MHLAVVHRSGLVGKTVTDILGLFHDFSNGTQQSPLQFRPWRGMAHLDLLFATGGSVCCRNLMAAKVQSRRREHLVHMNVATQRTSQQTALKLLVEVVF